MTPKELQLKRISRDLPRLISLLEKFNGADFKSLESVVEKIKGEKGDKGLDGKTPKRGVDYFTKDDVENILSELWSRTKGVVKGVRGETGLQGLPGRTPEKGVDYMTEEEINSLVKKISSLSTPIKGLHYKDGQDGKPGKDGKDAVFNLDDLIKTIKKTKKLGIEDLYNFPSKGFQDQRWHGGGNTIQDPVDLSAQLNGVKKAFTISGAMSSSKIVGVYGSSAPFTFRPLIDYTWSSPTLTFTASVDAPSALALGQTLIVQITK